MTQNIVLDVAIGLVFFYLLSSLLASTIEELIAVIFAYRGRILERGLEQIDVMAPGDALRSIFNPTILISGTSFSTPFVAGVIALLKSFAKSKNQTLSSTELIELIKTISNKGISNYHPTEYGQGIIQPVSTVNILSNNS